MWAKGGISRLRSMFSNNHRVDKCRFQRLDLSLSVASVAKSRDASEQRRDPEHQRPASQTQPLLAERIGDGDKETV
jgi:hypothetical protein